MTGNRPPASAARCMRAYLITSRVVDDTPARSAERGTHNGDCTATLSWLLIGLA